MTCPKCLSANSICIDSRITKENSIRRRRRCADCDYRWTTYEVSDEDYYNLVRRNARIAKALQAACNALANEIDVKGNIQI